MIRFETGMSENNLPNWNALYCVKEFIQNVVYAKTILGDSINIKYEDGKAILQNSPSGFNKGKLLIGESEQRGTVGAPGNWGEGIKAAMCVGRRLGIKITLQTNGFKVIPELEPSSLDPSVKSLVFYIEDNDIHEGTTVEIECSEEILEEAKSAFAVLTGVSEDCVVRDGILEDLEGGDIFVNGVKIAETNSLYSYNFTDASLMNRDRTTVDMDNVKANVRRTLATIHDVDQAIEVISSVTEEDDLLESQSGVNSFLTDDKVWKQAVTSMYGEKVAIATGTEADTKARYHKFSLITKVPNNWKYFFNDNLAIYPTNQLDEVALNPTRVKVKPKGEESANLGWCKRLVKLYYGDYGTVKVAETVLDSFKNECDGVYDKKTDTIWIARRLLTNKEECFKTLLHETIHRVTGAPDNSSEFTRGWEDACWGILQRGKK